MSGRIESTADMVLEKYDGTLEKLREAAGRNPQKEMKLIREFKGVGETGVNIFCREAQLHWEELFPFADQRSLDTLAHHGIHCSSAQEVANLVDNDRSVSSPGQPPILYGAVSLLNRRCHECQERHTLFSVESQVRAGDAASSHGHPGILS